MLDDITQAVLARDDVARYLRGGHGQTELEARERIHAYLDELRTTQRYPIYRALKHPLYPILRKIERIEEHVDLAQQAVYDVTERRVSEDFSILADMLQRPLQAVQSPEYGCALGAAIHPHLDVVVIHRDVLGDDGQDFLA